MEAMIGHSPITCNGPIYSTNGNSPFPVASIALAVPEVARQTARLHMQTQHTVALGDSAFQLWHPGMSTYAFQSAHRKKKKDCLSFPSASLKLTIAALRKSSSKSISWEAAQRVSHFSLPHSSHQLDSWLGLAVPPSVQWTYEASCLDVPSTAIGNQCSRRSPGCMMSEGGGGQHLYRSPMRSGR